MPTYRLITDQQVETDCADLLPKFEQYQRDFRQSVACPSGFTVLPRITMMPGESLSALRDRILAAGQCDYNDLMGDAIPFPVLHEYPFGHVPDAVPGDGVFFAPGPMTVDSGNIVTSKPDADPFGAFGRIGPFNVESTDTRTSTQKYRDWIADQMNPLPWLYAPEVDVDDHFAFPPYADIGIGARAQIPAGWTVHEMVGLTETGDNNDFQDGEWAIIAARPVLCNINLDGGFWNRLYNTGSSKDWRAANPGAYLEVIFGSEQDEFWSDDNLMVTAISTPYCNCCYIDWWGQEQLHLFFAGWPVGAVQRALGYYAKKHYGTIQGSCATMLLDPQLALVQMQQRLTTIEAEIPVMQANIQTALAGGTGGGGTTGGTGSGGTTGATALAWNLGGPDVGAFKGSSADNGSRLDTPGSISVAGVLDAAAVTIYQTGDYNGGKMTITRSGIAPGNYRLLLHGVEGWWSSPGQRVMDISVNGSLLFPGVDWFKVAGAKSKAAVVSAPVTIGADGTLTVTLTSKAGDTNVWICGVEMRSP